MTFGRQKIRPMTASRKESVEHKSDHSEAFRQSQSNVRQHSIAINDIKLLSINVCGLKGRLNSPEFITLINSFDITGVQETKLDDADSRINDCLS